MKVAVCSIMYNEERFVKPFLQHIPDWVDEKLVLVSSVPWHGKPELPDKTDEIAKECGATVIVHNWKTEAEQRNAGQDYLHDYDWIIILDPDEFLDKNGWDCLKQLTSGDEDFQAGVVNHQRVFWKDKEVSPHTDYQQIILVKPSVRFSESRVVNTNYVTLPIALYHFSWARTDKEVLNKLYHYSHANEIDTDKWYKEVWKSDKQTDLHPLTPETLKGLIEPSLPPEIAKLNLWP